MVISLKIIAQRAVIGSIIGLLLLIGACANISGFQPIISSRVSKVLEITKIASNQENKTVFQIDVEVEILNRANENQTVYELSDFNPKVFINAKFVNSSLTLEQFVAAQVTIVSYTYPPGITNETATIEFYINASGLEQLPDGNYTLWREINTAYPFVNETTAEAKLTNITVIDGQIEIYYPEFDFVTQTTVETSFTFLVPTIIAVVIITLSYYTKSIKKHVL